MFDEQASLNPYLPALTECSFVDLLGPTHDGHLLVAQREVAGLLDAVADGLGQPLPVRDVVDLRGSGAAAERVLPAPFARMLRHQTIVMASSDHGGPSASAVHARVGRRDARGRGGGPRA